MEIRERLTELLSDYFSIGDSYHYILNRAKDAFHIGTIGLDDFKEYDDDDVAEIAEYLTDNGVTIHRWISVTNRLPPAEGWYVVWTKTKEGGAKSFNKAYFCHGNEWHGSGGRWRNVTHWMPMPESPKED